MVLLGKALSGGTMPVSVTGKEEHGQGGGAGGRRGEEGGAGGRGAELKEGGQEEVVVL